MKVISYNEYGGSDVLEISNLPLPTINDLEILVKVKAVSINPIDWKLRSGAMKFMSGNKFPKYVGGEFSGVVVKVGKQVMSYAPGDEVFGLINHKRVGGALQEYIAVTSESITIKPPVIGFELGACISTVGMAAMKGLYQLASLKPEKKILINGCAGNLGLLAAQIALHEKMEVTGVCTGNHAFDLLRSIGVQHIVDYKKNAVKNLDQRFDIILDTAHSVTFKEIQHLLYPKGIFLNPTPTLPQILGVWFCNVWRSKKHKIILGSADRLWLKRLSYFFEKRGFVLPIHRIYAFSEYKNAFKEAEKAGFIGKIVITLP